MNNKYNTLGFDKIYVINLKRRKDRRDKLIADNPNIDFTFIEAIDGKDLNLEQLLEEGKINNSFFDPTGMVTMNIFACALSHKKAWDQAIEDGVENALILEDDVYFVTPFLDTQNKNLSPLYKNILNDINQYDWDILQFGKKKQYVNGIFVGKYFVVPRCKSNYDGAHAYAVTKETLQTLSDNCLPVKYAADVYIEGYYNSHNLFTLKESLIRQVSDTTDPQNHDSDTYYNDYRLGGGKVGISFDEKGNIVDKRIANYLKHPNDILNQHTEIILGRPKFGLQNFNKDSYFGISDMLKYIEPHLDQNHQMVELFSHLGEISFYFGCSGLFKNIYCIDPLKGEDKFNIDNNMFWEDIRIGFHSNTYHFPNINHIEQPVLDVVDSFKDISFLYINNRNQRDITPYIKSYIPKMKKEGFIGGNGPIDFIPTITFNDGSWLIKIKHYKF